MARIHYVDPESFSETELLKTAHEPEELPEELQPLLESPIRNVYRALANNEPATRAFREWMGTVWQQAGLSIRERELVILTAARTVDSRYEWHQHVRHAITAGIEPEEIIAISTNPGDPQGFEPREQALITYAHGVCADTVTDAMFESFATFVDQETVVGTTMLAAGYLGLAHMLHAMEVDTEEPFVGWELERLGKK